MSSPSSPTSVGRLRARVAVLRDSLASLPLERERLVERRTAAEHELTAATAGVEAAEARVAELSRSRRRREDELERAEKEASTAREALTDSKARLARVEESSNALQTLEQQYSAESDEAATEVGRLAVAIGANARVASSTTRDPGRGLEALEEWASQARSALFVAGERSSRSASASSSRRTRSAPPCSASSSVARARR